MDDYSTSYLIDYPPTPTPQNSWEKWLGITLAINPVPDWEDTEYFAWLRDKIFLYARGDEELCEVIWSEARSQYRRKSSYREYLASPVWRDIRDQKLIDEARCHFCGTPRGLNVHHLRYPKRGMEKMDDLIVLCYNCHRRHHQDQRWGVDE